MPSSSPKAYPFAAACCAARCAAWCAALCSIVLYCGMPPDLSLRNCTGQDSSGSSAQPCRKPYLEGPPVIVSPGEKVPFTLGQVAVFLAVARTGGPTSAAQALNISQPAVSKSVSGLEQVTLPPFSCLLLAPPQSGTAPKQQRIRTDS